MDELQKAFQEWCKYQPRDSKIPKHTKTIVTELGQTLTVDIPAHFDGLCCHKSHEYRLSQHRGEPMPDDRVCDRERAWRKYVRLRDGLEQTIQTH